MSQVEILKRRRIRFRDTYGERYETVEWLDARDVSDTVVVFDFEAKIGAGDRLIFDRRVFDIESTTKDIGQMVVRAFVIENKVETTLLRMAENGADVEYGIAENLKKDHEAERWMDSWVGIYALHIIQHYKRVRSGRNIGELFNAFDLNTAVACVGAGPSLDRNVDELRQFPGLIICADRAYKPLKARGIDPDLVLSVDCHDNLIAEMLRGPDSAADALVLNTCTDPKTADTWKGQVFWFNMRHPGVQFMDHVLPVLFPDFGSLENSGNVGNGSVLLADLMGLSPMVLVGQDYSYTGGKMFADRWEFTPDGQGARRLEDDHAALLEKRTGKVEVGGVVTYAPFLTYAESLMAHRERRKLEIINCTEGGILTGITCRPLAEMCGELRARVAQGELTSRDDAKKRITRIKEDNHVRRIQ